MNILVVRNDKLGDFVMAIPTFYVLKKYNPDNKIIACVAPVNKSLAQSLDFIDEVVVDDTTSAFALAKKLKMVKADVSITLFSNTKVAFAQFLAGIKTRIAPATKIAQIFYTKRVLQRRSRIEKTEIEYNLDLAKSLFSDIDLTYKTPLVEVEEKETIQKDFKASYKIPQSKKIIAFHPGFGGTAEVNWSLNEYLLFAKELIKEEQYQVVFTFGPGEYHLYDKAKEANVKNIVLYKSVSTPMEFARLLSGFSLFISISTGASHLASLVGTSTLTFFAGKFGSSSARWKGVSAENKQCNKVIPLDKEKKQKNFLEVKETFQELVLKLV